MAPGRDPKGALIALNRFGLGARGGASGDFASAAADPRGFVKAELARPGVAMLDAPTLHSTPQLLQALFDDQEKIRIAREQVAQANAVPAATAQSSPGSAATVQPASAQGPMPPVVPPKPSYISLNIEGQAYRAEALARFRRASQAEVGFVERLATFWSNHFAVSVAKDQFVRASVGSFEREAIRPYIFGRFADMLLAVEKHPTMIHYLDNQSSVGPNSRYGLRSGRGLNENLAREIMELHTLGVGSGYTQADVTTLAKIITGWTHIGRESKLGEPGTFAFVDYNHEPGLQKLLGRFYPDIGVQQGELALEDIARQPATAHFIATKLVRHFVADDPPPALVDRLADVYRRTDGDLRAVTVALLDADAAWTAPLTKMRTPYEFLLASSRLLGRLPEDPGLIMGSLNQLGQPLWQPPGPNGFADTQATWMSPEGLKLRSDIAWNATKNTRDGNPLDILDDVLGDAVSPETRQTVARAESKQQGLALLLMSPEVQRR